MQSCMTQNNTWNDIYWFLVYDYWYKLTKDNAVRLSRGLPDESHWSGSDLRKKDSYWRPRNYRQWSIKLYHSYSKKHCTKYFCYECKYISYHHPVCVPGVGANWVHHPLCVWSWEPGSRKGHTCLDRSAGHCGWYFPPLPRSGMPNQSLSLCMLPMRERAETLIHFLKQASLSVLLKNNIKKMSN